MNFHHHHVHIDDATMKKRDPTGTLPLRDKFRRDLDKRWDALRKLVIEAISKSDILGLGGMTVEAIVHSSQRTQHSVLPSADKVKGFQSWIDEAMRLTVLAKDGSWTAPYIERATVMAKARAEALTGRNAMIRQTRVRDLQSLTVVELQGIIEAVSQQSVRVLAHDLMANARPSKIARDIAMRIEKVGRARGRMMAAYMVVKAFNSSTLDAFRSLGIRKVGTVPERLKIKQTAHGKTLAKDGGPGSGPHAQGGTPALINHTEMREYSPKELDWEYNREYLVYAKPSFPDAFKSREDFQKQYDAAPLVHLSVDQLKSLQNSAAAGGLGKSEAWIHKTFGSRRDTKAIVTALTAGKTAPPIVLQHGSKLFLMAGQTRLAAGMALGKSVPVKLIKVKGKTDDAQIMLADAKRKSEQLRHGITGKFIKHPKGPGYAPTPKLSWGKISSIIEREARLAQLEQVEVLTAGDDFVCQVCEDISDDGPYDIDEAETLIPAHPDCRCAFVPAQDERFASDADFDPALHPHGEHGHFAETGQQQQPKAASKNFVPSSSFAEHTARVNQALTSEVSKTYFYRWKIGKLAEEAKDFNKHDAIPALKLKIAESFGIERKEAIAKGDGTTADKLQSKMIQLGWKPDGSQPPSATKAPAVTPPTSTKPDPISTAIKTDPPSKLAMEKYTANTISKGAQTPLEIGKEKIKATVQTGGDLTTAIKILSPEQNEAVLKQYGSITDPFNKSQKFYQQEQANKQAAAKATAAQAEKIAAAKAAEEKIANDPETKEHYQVLKDITGGGEAAKNYLNAAASKVKSAGLTGKISAAEAAHIVAYSGSHYGPVNKQLRMGQMTEQQWGFAKSLNGALGKLDPHVGVTYRKASMEEGQANLYKAGMIIEERGFMSSSKNSGTWSGDMRFEIHGSSGRDISSLSQHPSESEVLFKSGTHFRVESRSGNKIVLKEVE